MSHKNKVFLGLTVKPSEEINLNFKCTDVLETFKVHMFMPEQYFFFSLIYLGLFFLEWAVTIWNTRKKTGGKKT